MRIGIISFAHMHAEGYLEALRVRPGIELLATDPGPYAPGETRGRELAVELGVDYADTVVDLLAWQPDAVIVTAENALHRRYVELAAAAGAHILCEKPLATTWADGLAMRDAAERAGVVLMVAFPVRFASAFQQLRYDYRSGRLGELVAIRGANNGMLPLGRSWFTQPALSGGGSLVDHVVHLGDLIEALAGPEPLRVTAVTNRILHARRAGAETAGLVTVEYHGGLIAAIDCSWSRPDTSPVWGGLSMAVYGTGGSAEIDLFEPAVRGLDASTGRPLILRYGPSFDAPMLDAFLAAVRGERPELPSVETGLRTLSIVLAAQESARTHRTVDVAEVCPR